MLQKRTDSKTVRPFLTGSRGGRAKKGSEIMQKQVYALIGLAAAAGLGALRVLVIGGSSVFWLGEFFVSSAAAAIMALICLINYLLRKRRSGKGVSPWKLFAVIDVLLIVLLVLWSVWDMETDTGFMAGIGGAVGLYYGVPLLAVLLVVELLIYNTVRSKNEPPKAEPPKEQPVDIVSMKKDDWRKEK